MSGNEYAKDTPSRAEGATPSAPRPKRHEILHVRVRRAVLAMVFIAACVGIFARVGTGTLSSFGWDFVATICPLGALEALFGVHAFVPRLIIGLAAMLVLVLGVGASFCSWACPIPPLNTFFRTKKELAADEQARKQAADLALARWHGAEPCARPRVQLDTRHGVLAGVLAATAVFGFPVFCLVCPVGLTFGVVALLAQLLGGGGLSWGLVAFPLLLVLEMTVLRKWCTKVCPISALLSLVASFNKTFRPQADAAKCNRSAHGVDCSACSLACPRFIDPRGDFGLRPQSECTRCGACAQACPQGAIHFPFLAKAADEKDVLDTVG